MLGCPHWRRKVTRFSEGGTGQDLFSCHISDVTIQPQDYGNSTLKKAVASVDELMCWVESHKKSGGGGGGRRGSHAETTTRSSTWPDPASSSVSETRIRAQSWSTRPKSLEKGITGEP